MATAALFQSMTKGFDLAQAIAEADRCLLCHDPPCSKGCPAETDPGTFIRKLRLHNVTGAIRTIKSNNILGGACGVLCPTPRLCEKACSATGINRRWKSAGSSAPSSSMDGQSASSLLPRRKPAGKSRSSGRDGGISCAAELAQEGFAVTIFEERSEPGGVIRYGVPAYRFDTAFLTHELADLLHLGVEIVCNTRIDGSTGARKLLQQGFKAVFLGPGLWAADRIPGADSVAGVLTSVDFLSLIRQERFAEMVRQVEGKAVAVIGGGSVAMDCVESAAKLGARDVYLVYRRSFAQMPAEQEERLAALRLGVHFLVLNQPLGYAVDGKGALTGVNLVRTRLGEPDGSGRRKPETVKGSEWTLEAQLAVEAIGNRPDAADWSGLVKTGSGGLVIVDETSGKTSTAFVYAGGDISRGAGLVVEAVQDGKRAARAIREALA